jgi:imidazolonepropionase-like amidohydrolase
MRGAVTTRLAGGFVYDSPSGTFRRADLLVRGERIVGLEGPLAEPGAIDVGGLYLLPGLIDCHVHLGMRAEDADPAAVAARPDADIARDMAEAADGTLRGGVTTVRDLGGWNHLEMALRDQIARGDRSGPRLLLAGRLLSMPTGAADYYPGMYEIASGPTAVEGAARAQLARGADHIKVMATGAMLSPEDEDAGATQFGPEELRAAVETAAADGKPVAAHAHATLGIRNATLAGVASIEHGTYADDEVLHLMAERGTFLVPTLMASTAMLRDPVVRDAMPTHLRDRLTESQATHQDAVRRARRAGVPIAMGTDAGTPGNRHGANADELVAMVEEAGLSPQEAIHAATLAAARLIQRGHDLGSLEPGRIADVIGLAGDPTNDIMNVTQVRFVVLAGAVVRDDR